MAGFLPCRDKRSWRGPSIGYFRWGAIGCIGFAAGIVWAAYTHSTEFNSQHNRDARRDFRKAILSAQSPCVAVQDKLSDLSACTAFGLRAGTDLRRDFAHRSTARAISKTSRNRLLAHLPTNAATSFPYIKDGIYLRVEFKGDPKSAKLDERVSKHRACSRRRGQSLLRPKTRFWRHF